MKRKSLIGIVVLVAIAVLIAVAVSNRGGGDRSGKGGTEEAAARVVEPAHEAGTKQSSSAEVTEEWWEERPAGTATVTYRYEQKPHVLIATQWNYERGYIEVVTQATSDMTDVANDGHAMAIAYTVARAFAYEELASALEIVLADADATIVDLMRGRDDIRAQMFEAVKRARVIEWPDGGDRKEEWVDGLPRVSFRLGLPMTGLHAVVARPFIEYLVDQEARAETEAKAVPGGAPQASPDDRKEPAFTGIMVIASEYPVRPCLFPRIVTRDGKELFGPGIVDREVAISRGPVSYAKAGGPAEAYERAGDHALVVKAVGVAGKQNTDLVVSEEDSSKIAAAEWANNVLRDCMVVVVLK